jgi:protease-4
MARLLLLPLLMLAVGGCRRPLHVITDGFIQTGGTVKLVPLPDHTATALAARRLPFQPPTCQGTIALLDVDGLLLNRNMTGLGSMGENPVALFREKLAAAAADPNTRAVVLRINSPGGGVTASDVMRRDLESFKRRRPVPVVACLMDVGTGGAYYLATAADVIVAHPTTITGGIGVILNLYNLQDTMAQFNVLGAPIKAGPHIDLGSPIAPLAPEARVLLQRAADEFRDRFCLVVTASRPLASPVPPEIFDGRIFTAAEATRLKLVDSTGYLDDAVAIARELAHVDERAALVMFRRSNDRALSPYDVTPNIPLQNTFLPVSLPGLDRSQLPTFLYLWQPEPLLEKTGGQ